MDVVIWPIIRCLAERQHQLRRERRIDIELWQPDYEVLDAGDPCRRWESVFDGLGLIVDRDGDVPAVM